jgi:hypothetical protein
MDGCQANIEEGGGNQKSPKTVGGFYFAVFIGTLLRINRVHLQRLAACRFAFHVANLCGKVAACAPRMNMFLSGGFCFVGPGTLKTNKNNYSTHSEAESTKKSNDGGKAGSASLPHNPPSCPAPAAGWCRPCSIVVCQVRLRSTSRPGSLRSAMTNDRSLAR